MAFVIRMLFVLFPVLSFSAVFTSGPTLTALSGGQWQVGFTVSDTADVTVWVEDVSGKIIRHIASARVGAAAVPAPFAGGSFSQTIVWDGKDDTGAVVSAQGWKIKTGLGLKAEFDAVLGQDDQNLPPVIGLGIGPDGSVYVLSEGGGDAAHTVQMVVLDREGNYLRTILPTPPDLSGAQINGLGVISVPGGWLPRMYCPTGRSFFPLTGRPTHGNDAGANQPQTMAVGPSGIVFRFNRIYGQDEHISMINSDGSVPGGTTIGPFFSQVSPTGPIALAISRDGKRLYAANIPDPACTNPYAVVMSHAVWRLTVSPAMGSPEVALGTLNTAGNDNTHFNNPTGVALDSAENIYVADQGNNRVAVFDSARNKIGQIDVTAPVQAAVDPKTGRIYVLTYPTSSSARISRYDSINATAVSAFRDASGMYRAAVMAADFTGSAPVFWLGSDGAYGGYVLARIVDSGSVFSPAVERGKGGGVSNFKTLGLDPATDDLYVRLGWYSWKVFRGGTGTGISLSTSDNKGAAMDVGPDGTRWWLGRILTGVNDAGGDPTLGLVRTTGDDRTHVPLSGSVDGLPLWDDNLNARGFSVGPDGSIYAVQYSGDNHGPTHVRAYNADGTPKQDSLGEIIANLNADACSPQADRQGRIYVADNARPQDMIVPPLFQDNSILLATTGPVHNLGADFYPQTYGSIMRFAPSGGSLERITSESEAGSDPVVLSPGYWNDHGPVSYPGAANGFHLTAARGCDMVLGGVAPVVGETGNRIYCQCQHAEFELDGFDRIFVPDAPSCEVRVYDCEGNLLTRFGAYGNADCKGPSSAKPAPEIPLAWAFSAKVSDRYVYIGDNLNRRVIKARLTYTDERSADPSSISSRPMVPFIKEGIAVFRIYNVKGQLVRSVKSDSRMVRRLHAFEQGLPSGLYVYRISGSGIQRTLKRMVLR